jgi:general secretion pathway protein K
MKYMGNNRGSVTILTLLISMVIITIAIGFNWIVKAHLTAADGLRKKSEALLNVVSAYDSLIYSLMTATFSQRDITFSTKFNVLGVRTIPLDGTQVELPKEVRISLRDPNGLVSLANPDSNVLQRLIKVVKPQDEASPIIADSLLDWVDADRVARPNGAEESAYRMENKPYSARNYPIQYKEELGFIRGVDEGLYKKLSSQMTLLPNMGFNPNTASDEVLMAYLAIDREVVKKLRGFMQLRPVASDSELFALTGRTISANGEGLYYFPVRWLEVSVSSGTPLAYYTIHAGIDLRLSAEAPYRVVYWNEE